MRAEPNLRMRISICGEIIVPIMARGVRAVSHGLECTTRWCNVSSPCETIFRLRVQGLMRLWVSASREACGPSRSSVVRGPCLFGLLARQAPLCEAFAPFPGESRVQARSSCEARSGRAYSPIAGRRITFRRFTRTQRCAAKPVGGGGIHGAKPGCSCIRSTK